MNEFGTTLLSALLGVGVATILWAFYRKSEEDWPISYQTVSTPFDLAVRRHLLLHFITRVIPVFAASLATASLATQLGFSAAVAVTSLIALHLATTTLRAAWRASHRRFRRALIVFYDVGLSAALVVAAWFGLRSAEAVPWLVPSPSVFRDGIWVAIAVVVIGKLAELLTRDRDDDGHQLTRLAERDIGRSALSVIPGAALRHESDESLLRAIIYAESLQRTRFLRRLERAKGRFHPAGTYGVAQVKADAPIDDATSIERLAESLAGSRSALAGSNSAQELLIDAYVQTHSLDTDLLAQVHAFFDAFSMTDRCLAQSDTRAPDGRAILEVLEVTRQGFDLRINGTAWVRSQQERPTVIADAQPVEVRATAEPTCVLSRISWASRVSLTTESVSISLDLEEIDGRPASWAQGWA